jgi:hypothetical protein
VQEPVGELQVLDDDRLVDAELVVRGLDLGGSRVRAPDDVEAGVGRDLEVDGVGDHAEREQQDEGARNPADDVVAHR